MHLLKTNPRAVLRRLLPALSLSMVVVACSSGGSAGWTYAPLGPTPEPTGTSGPTSGPSGSPGLAVQVETPQSDPLAFVPNTLEVPAATVVQVDYNNDSNLPHNINFFDGPDNSAPSLGATAVVTGPAALESVTFTTPSEPGTYFFWCDVHLDAMTGTYTVTP